MKLVIPERISHVEPVSNLFTNVSVEQLKANRIHFSRITEAFVQSGEGVPNLKAYLSLSLEFSKRGMIVHRFTAETMDDFLPQITPNAIVVGGLVEVHRALTHLCHPLPPSLDYPDPLLPFLCRKIKKTTIQDIRENYFVSGGTPIFIKPVERKQGGFVGMLARNENCIILQTLPPFSEIWCSEPVQFISEFRVFVLNGNILGITQYEGPPSSFHQLDIPKIVEAVVAQDKSGQSAYILDFGVLSSGETALVEWTDSYSVGTYGLEAERYADLLLTRWLELTQNN